MIPITYYSGINAVKFDKLWPFPLGRMSSSLFNKFLYIVRYFAGKKMPGISFDWFSIGANEEFFKVPCDVGSLDWFPYEKLGVKHESLGVIAGMWQVLLQPLEH